MSASDPPRTDPPLHPAPAGAEEARAASPDPSTDPLAAAAVARVVAWHNRHPLARRIDATQVAGLGEVALPVRADAGRAPWRHWRPVFDPQFTPRGHRAGIAAFAARHGQPESVRPPGWPQRIFEAVAPRGGAMPATELRHLITAAIEVGGQRRRVLISPAPDGPLHGPRHWAPVRVRALAAALALPLLGLAGWGVAHRAASVDAPTVAAPALASPVAAGASVASAASLPVAGVTPPASAAAVPLAVAATAGPAPAVPASAASATAPTAPVVPAVAASAVAGLAAPASAVAATPAARASAPVGGTLTAQADVPAAPAALPAPAASAPSAVSATLPLAAVRPALSAAEREQARAVSQQARARTLLARAAADPQVLLYALTTPPVRREPQARALRDTLRAAAARQPSALADRVDVWPTAAGWQAAWWPFASAEEALAQRAALQAQGIDVSVVPF